MVLPTSSASLSVKMPSEKKGGRKEGRKEDLYILHRVAHVVILALGR